MTDLEKTKLLEFCGFKKSRTGWRNLDFMPEFTCDWLFKYFVPAWDKRNPPKKQIDEVRFAYNSAILSCQILVYFEIGSHWATGFGATEAEAFQKAALKLIGK